MKPTNLNFGSIEELKRFFRKKIKELHPDRGGDATNYREFLDWYQKAIDNFKKREQIKVLKNYQPAANSIYKIVEFSARELALALSKKLKLPLFEITCPLCAGQGLNKKGKRYICDFCKGKGWVFYYKEGEKESGKLKCHVCDGKGFIYKEKCPQCFGKGKIKEEIEIEIKLPPGVRDGDILFLKGENFSVDYDFYIEVVQISDPSMTLEKDKLIINCKVPFTDILLKEKITIETLEGLEEIPTELVRRGEPIIFPGRGPYLAETDLWERGDLVINIQVLFPEKVPLKAKKLVEKLVYIMEGEENGNKKSTET
ncbi:MAG: DnaJ C-terminal domain-containing protein [Caldimicrobium sp.]